MSPKAKLWTAAIAAGITGALLGAGAIMALHTPAPEATPADPAQLAVVQKQLDQKDALIEDLTRKLNSASDSAATPTSTTTSSPAPASTTTKQFAFVADASGSGGNTTVSADYAEFLTGKAAETAATAHGDESPPPNDYYIVNDNRKLRTLRVQPGIKVKLTARDDGTSEPDGYRVPLATWVAYFSAPSDDTGGITAGPYWLTVTDGVVTAIEEQYTP